MRIGKTEKPPRDDRAWIQTFTGRQFWPLDPRPEEVCIEDIAHALSNCCRFTGHVKKFYSVAQHCVYASQLTVGKLSLKALLHDASEAYLVDLPRPLKHHPEFGAIYREVERKLQTVIYETFGLDADEPEQLKLIDSRLLMTERRDLMAAPTRKWSTLDEPLPIVVEPWSPVVAERIYLATFWSLVGRN